MTQSKLIELTYFDPKSEVRLTAYADTIIMDHDEKGKIISAIRFGGYPEIVRGLADAIYGGATVDAIQNGNTVLLQSRLKGYERQLSHDGQYAVATLMSSDGDYNSNRRTTKRRTKSKKLPGVSPLVYSRFLLEYTAFLSLTDMGKDLPDYEEIPVPLKLPEKVYTAYEKAENILQTTLKLHLYAAGSNGGYAIKNIIIWR